MKLTELSKRDYIAIEVARGFVSLNFPDTDKWAVKRAYAFADAMIAHESQPARDREVEDLRKSVDALRTSNEVLRNLIPHNERAATTALEQIWEFLGVTNQTAAMQMLRDAFPELVK